jgi:hypothetical protein
MFAMSITATGEGVVVFYRRCPIFDFSGLHFALTPDRRVHEWNESRNALRLSRALAVLNEESLTDDSLPVHHVTRCVFCCHLLWSVMQSEITMPFILFSFSAHARTHSQEYVNKNTETMKTFLVTFLALVLPTASFVIQSRSAHSWTLASTAQEASKICPLLPPPTAPMATFEAAMGWFWGPQRDFDDIEGVIDTVVGYSGSHNPDTANPTYRDIQDCTYAVDMTRLPLRCTCWLTDGSCFSSRS